MKRRLLILLLHLVKLPLRSKQKMALSCVVTGLTLHFIDFKKLISAHVYFRILLTTKISLNNILNNVSNP